MSTSINPTPGRIVWYRGADGEIRAAIVARVNGPFNVNLTVFGLHAADPECGPKDSVTHADPEHESACFPSWHWMPYQIGQAKKHADEPKILGAGAARQVNAGAESSEASIEREIQAKGLTAPRLSPADLDANIVHTEIVKHVSLTGQVLRWAVLTTKNGFAVVGKPSVAVSPENDNDEIGTQVAVDNSRTELWPLMGYALKQQLHQAAYERPAPGAAHAGYGTLAPHQQRVVDEKAELDEKLAKLGAFFDTPIYAGLSNAEQHRLHGQSVAMKAYSDILGQRIEAFTLPA